jgi:dTDP-4-dehydrorhamnose reductase
MSEIGADGLILGCKGTLGCQLAKLLPGAGQWDREEIDVTDARMLETMLLRLRPRVVFNCIAFNDVDGAESNPDGAFGLNAEYVGRLAGLTRTLGARLVHFSTNYVFDGSGSGEYREDDRANPLSVYGKSKRRGEELALEAGGETYVIRTAVLFGPKGASAASKKSFVDIMLDLSAKSGVVRAVSDEVNSVTYAPDLASAAVRLAASGSPAGIYHFANSGSASWFDLAAEIFRALGRPVQLEAVGASAFPRKALRPARSVLLNTKATPLRNWQAALGEYLAGVRL